MDNTQEALKLAQRKIEYFILQTPSGEERNELTEINIKCLAAINSSSAPLIDKNMTDKLQYLKEVLQTIQDSTRPVAQHSDPLSINDCWKEVFDTIKELSAPLDKASEEKGWKTSVKMSHEAISKEIALMLELESAGKVIASQDKEIAALKEDIWKYKQASVQEEKSADYLKGLEDGYCKGYSNGVRDAGSPYS